MIDTSIIGKKFGLLTVKSYHHSNKNGGTWWLCECDCGKEKVVYRGNLTSGDTISCGCYHKAHNSEYGFKHGKSKDKMYKIWSGMVQRCTNPNASNYKRYGGRGITVCDEWRNNPKLFIDWAYSHGYKNGLTLDRIDNDSGYSPNNCRWITPKQQSENSRASKMITYNGITHNISDWSKILGVNRETLRYRISKNNYSDFSELITEVL